MLTQKPTPEMYYEWMSVWKANKDKLKPNRRGGNELIDYLFERYTLTELDNEHARDVVAQNVLQNEHLARKLPLDELPAPRAFIVERDEKSEPLYENRAEVFAEVERIFVGVDAASGYYTVEGSDVLWDELCAFQGLDREDIENSFKVAQYVSCVKRFGTGESAAKTR